MSEYCVHRACHWALYHLHDSRIYLKWIQDKSDDFVTEPAARPRGGDDEPRPGGAKSILDDLLGGSGGSGRPPTGEQRKATTLDTLLSGASDKKAGQAAGGARSKYSKTSKLTTHGTDQNYQLTEAINFNRRLPIQQWTNWILGPEKLVNLGRCSTCTGCQLTCWRFDCKCNISSTDWSLPNGPNGNVV